MLSSVTTDQLLDLATERHRAGNLPEARRLYQQVLEQSPAHTVGLFRFGLLELQEGHAEAALPLISQAAAAAPSERRYQFGLGKTLAALRRWDDAMAAYKRVLQLDAKSADAYFALGNSLAEVGNHADAIDAYRSAVQLQPDFTDAFNNLGNAHRILANLPQAMTAYERALELQPDHAVAMSNLGSILHAQGQTDRAIKLLHAAVKLEPQVTTHAVNLAAAICDRRQFTEAALLLQKVLEIDPANAQALHNLGNALHGLGRLREAVEQYRKAIALQPDYADAMNNLGNVCKELGEFSPAMDAFESAIRTRPAFVAAMNNAGCLLRTLGKLEEAEVMLRRALKIDDRHPALYDNLGNVLKDAGQLDTAIDCFRRSLELDPASWATHGNLVYALSFSSRDGQAILDEALRWNQRHAVRLQSQIRAHSNDRDPNRRLRIGYVSPDFREHCQSLFTIPLLSNHDHDQFEIFCYSSVERPDACTGQIAGYADVWREVRPLDDGQLADLIRADRIDILVDLTMHMAGGRPLLLARKPAPVQIAWLAYPGTTGISTMDYRLSDPRLDPPEFDRQYSEKTIRLPDSFWCYDPLTDQPEVNPLPALERGHITLGCLNNPCKLTDGTLRLWSGVMRALPTAKLVLMIPPGTYRQRLLDRLAIQEITTDRVSFLPFRPRVDYLRSYHQIDLGLDTLPYNGHTTSLDSLWMGVPVVTRVGQTCVGRGGLSQLFQLDLVELAAESDEKFVSVAVEWASDLERLAEVRNQLRQRLERSPLMNGKRFAKNIEAVYRRSWEGQ
jgi:protein O-GlcNAc transferase